VNELDNQQKCTGTLTVTGTSLSCACRPTTCATQMACNTTIPDGCGGTLNCGGCSGGAACNAGSCCPSGQQPDGQGGCVCAPHRPCPRGTSWDENLCYCSGSRF
jgi:hypothetical protein